MSIVFFVITRYWEIACGTQPSRRFLTLDPVQRPYKNWQKQHKNGKYITYFGEQRASLLPLWGLGKNKIIILQLGNKVSGIKTGKLVYERKEEEVEAISGTCKCHCPNLNTFLAYGFGLQMSGKGNRIWKSNMAMFNLTRMATFFLGCCFEFDFIWNFFIVQFDSESC